ncbi:hypothetical protein ACER0A_011505 [Haloimpatiens sp. FM7315]|uniref:hypothetical protein n=1 Tax=Haloimpatiens sp. FM7315 TaxID=3298609 RepID=UPI0035A3C25D
MNKASSVAKGGLFTGLSIIFLYLSSIIPTNTLFFLCAAALVIPICLNATDVKYSILVYLASSLIGFSFLGFRNIIIYYTLFFGIYGIVKFFIEKLKNMPIEIILKLVFFNFSLFLIYYIYKATLFVNLNLDYEKYKYIIFLALQLIFIAYDYIFSMFIYYISKNFIKKIK